MRDFTKDSNVNAIFMVGFEELPKKLTRRQKNKTLYVFDTVDDVLQRMQTQQPKLVVVNLDTPKVGGIYILLKLRRVHPKTRILVVSESEKYLEPSVLLGVSGYLLQDEIMEMLENGNDRFVSSSVFSDRAIVAWISKQGRWVTRVPVTPLRLTSREVRF